MKVVALLALLFSIITASSANDDHVAVSDELSNGSEEVQQMFVGKMLSMNCTSLNATDIIWLKNGTELSGFDENIDIYETNSSVILKEAKESDYGQYRCETRSKPVKYRDIFVYILSQKKLPNSYAIQVGDKLSLDCNVFGKPEPIVKWVKDDYPLIAPMNDTDHIQFSPNDKGVPNATVKIYEVTHEERGLYSCLVYLPDNDVPIRNSSTFVRVTDIYAALWPFLGIVAEVAILCLIIFIYERRRMKSEYDESETDQPDQPDQ